MKRIRPQLIAMMAAVLAPVVVLAALFALMGANVQHQLQMERILERVRALRLALDNEVDAHARLLRSQAERAELAGAPVADAGALREPFERLMRHQPRWAAVLVVEPDGRESLRVQRDAESPLPRLDERTLRLALQGRPLAGSGLVMAPGGRAAATFLAVPVLREGRVLRVVAAVIRHDDWLALLRTHPVGDGATLSLVDQDGLLVARTLNPDSSLGRRATDDFVAHTAARSDGTFTSTGLEGQRFYVAHSRLERLPWTLGTGVPVASTEAPLRTQLALLAGGVLLAMLIAAAVVVVLRRRILAALHALGDVSSLRNPAADASELPIGEAEQLRVQLRDTLRSETAARAEAETARAQAEAANRSKDDFLAMMAHELRNPISAMSTAVALLEAAHAAPETDRHAREVLRRQVQKMTRLVDDLLDAARVARGAVPLQLAPLDLRQLVDDALDACAAAGRLQHLQVERVLQPGVVVSGDALRIEQVVGNLLDNAAKFTPDGGRLRVTLQAVEGQAELVVADDGIGIDAGLLRRLFQPYTQADPGFDRARGGLGLGLHVVRRLVELHGGRVEAASDGPGRGARFTVHLPLAQPVPTPAPQRQSGGLPPLHVALVEDNADGREAVSRLLQLAGHTVEAAADGEAGLALLQREAFDVALVDLGLPRLDGLSLARRLNEGGAGANRPGVLLTLTAYGDAHTQADAEKAGFDGFLQKPFDLREFELTVLEARARRQGVTA